MSSPYPKRRANPRGDSRERYAAPSDVVITTLGSLLKNRRQIIAEQQARLGDEDGLNLQLWCAGNPELVQLSSVAIVGTREVSPEGAARSRRLSRELVAAGVVVVSGLAKGVDTEALTAAMDAGGRVIAVIGTPIDVAYPAENKKLQERIYREHLLISQFAPGTRVFPSNFPERNKLMAAISDATAIMEAGETSGTLHQAAECTRLGRWLFIARSTVENPALQWPRKFVGLPKVRTLTSSRDILDVICEDA